MTTENTTSRLERDLIISTGVLGSAIVLGKWSFNSKDDFKGSAIEVGWSSFLMVDRNFSTELKDWLGHSTKAWNYNGVSSLPGVTNIPA